MRNDIHKFAHAKEDCPLLDKDKEQEFSAVDILLATRQPHIHWNKFDENGELSKKDASSAISYFTSLHCEKDTD